MTMKKTFGIILLLLIVFSVSIPAFSRAAFLVPCETTENPGISSPDAPASTDTTVPKSKYNCDFNALLKLANNVINFVLFMLAMPIAAIMFAYAGWLYMSSGFKPAQKDTAKKIFSSVFFGILIAAGAWLLVNTILNLLGYDGNWLGFS